MKKLLLSLTFVPLAAHAWQFEAGVGVTKFDTQDGRWYQEGVAHEVKAVSPSFSLGVTGPLHARGSYGADWHADYVYLGRASASCQCTTRDADYDAIHHVAHAGPRAYFTGSGDVQGVAVTLEPYVWAGGLRWSLEAGAFAYHSTWSEGVYGWSWNTGDPTGDLHVQARAWHVVPVVGVAVGAGPWSVGYKHYLTGKGSSRDPQFPPLWNNANVIEFKYRF